MRFRALDLAAGSADDALVSEDTVQATNDVIENVQTVTSALHLPTWFGRMLFIVLVLVIIALAVKLINKTFARTTDAMLLAGNQNVTLISFARYVVLTVVYFIGGVVIISSIPGASDSLNALLASGGIIAVVVGLAGQQALGNVVGGVMILLFKPFVIGDFIRDVSTGVSGTVEEISLRHTAIRTAENKRIIIPNGKITDAIIENANYADSRVCQLLDIGITYESDMERAIELLREEVMKQPLHLDVRDPLTQANEPEVQVEVLELADSAVVLRAWLWAADTGSSFKLKFAVNKAIKIRFDQEGIDFAYPHLVVKN